MLKAVYEKLDDVPEQFRSLYAERGGKFELTGIEGIKTEGDVTRLQVALDKERNDHKTTKTKFAPLADKDINDIVAKLDSYEELKVAAEGKLDETKLEQIVSTRIRTQLAPVERERDQLKTQLADLSKDRDALKGSVVKRDISESLRKAATGAKVVNEALDDVLLLGLNVFELGDDGTARVKPDSGFTPGLSPDQWLTDIKQKRPHWWPSSLGGGATGGAGGSGGSNPWAKGAWSLSEQGAYVREHGVEKATAMAKAAGVVLGATKPAS